MVSMWASIADYLSHQNEMGEHHKRPKVTIPGTSTLGSQGSGYGRADDTGLIA